MKTPHPYRLRPYHNPDNVDESKVPPGWRMLYADEFPLPYEHGRRCRLFDRRGVLLIRENCTGSVKCITYIVPVA